MGKEFEFISEEELLEIDGGASWLTEKIKNIKYNGPGCVQMAKWWAQAYNAAPSTSPTITTWRR